MGLPESDDDLMLLHNPRCAKSRMALALLVARGLEFVERRYLEDPLSAGEIDDLEGRLGLPLCEWVRTGEADYGEAGLSSRSSPQAILAVMAKRPKLMQRPILIRGGAAVVGRPPETILELLP